MRMKTLKIMAVVGVTCLTLSACGQGTKNDSGKSSAMGKSSSSSAGTENPNSIPESMIKGSFKASISSWKAKKEYEFKKMGLKFSLSDTLVEKMKNKEVAMLPSEELNKDGSTKFGEFKFKKMNKEQSEREVSKAGDDYEKWVNDLEMEGSIGIFNSSIKEDEISTITGCDENRLLGETKDGKYKYYLSTNSKGDSSIVDEIRNMTTEIIEKENVESNHSIFEDDSMATQAEAGSSIKTKTINGDEFTDSEFSKYDLTMVNVMATWCGACVAEMPEIQKAYEDMKDKNVNIVGIVMDTFDGKDENADAIEKAKAIAEKTGVKFPLLLPDTTMFNGKLLGMQALPNTFFLDKNGNLVGDPVSGSRSYEEWKSIIEERLNSVRGK